MTIPTKTPHPADLASLAYLRDELHRARTAKAAADAEVKTALAAFEAEHADLLSRQKAAAGLVDEMYGKVAELAIEITERSGDKHPVPGVNVNETTTYTWDDGAAVAWAVAHAPNLLTINRAAYKLHLEQILKAGRDSWRTIGESMGNRELVALAAMPGEAVTGLKQSIAADLSKHVNAPNPAADGTDSAAASAQEQQS